ncbi:MAG: DUF6084 family protein [Solirubrobacteraceae bacterium MAG38_C4-C5]|nr:DUF6084 family protein [Candidatus Siliceabacter maunaloa]
MALPSPIDVPTGAQSAPALAFTVEGARAVQYAAVPTLRFALRVDSGGAAIRSLMLNVQLRIAAAQRGYDEGEQERLSELFGTPDRWSSTLRGLLWTHTTLVIPPFQGETVVDLDVPCTYDFEVTASKYLAALQDGEVPLELLFSGTVFHRDEAGRLSVSRISWDREAPYRMPVAVWRETMDFHFRGAAWLRLERETFDRLAAYKARHTLLSWETALSALLDRAEHAEKEA